MRRTCLATLVLLVTAGSAHAAGLLSMTGPIDRRTAGTNWCASEGLPPNPFQPYPSVTFFADGPQATFEFIASNIDSGIYWTEQSIDNICVVTRTTFDTYWQSSHGMMCTVCADRGQLPFDLVPPAEIVYLERFDSGTGLFDLVGGASFNALETAPRFPGGEPGDRDVGSHRVRARGVPERQ